MGEVIIKETVYKKLINARILLQKKEMKKTGKNTFQNYTYFELCDFLPLIQQVFNEVGLVDAISFDKDFAILKLYNVDDGSFIEFKSPMGTASLKGCHEVQNIGAVETYQRRYLYVTALALVEHDALEIESISEKEIKTFKENVNKNPKDILLDLIADNKEKLIKYIEDKTGKTFDELAEDEILQFIQAFQKAKKAKENNNG